MWPEWLGMWLSGLFYDRREAGCNQVLADWLICLHIYLMGSTIVPIYRKSKSYSIRQVSFSDCLQETLRAPGKLYDLF